MRNEKVFSAGVYIGRVYLDLVEVQREEEIEDWAFYHNPSDNEQIGFPSREAAIKELKAAHREWLSFRKKDLKKVMARVLPFLTSADKKKMLSQIIKRATT